MKTLFPQLVSELFVDRTWIGQEIFAMASDWYSLWSVTSYQLISTHVIFVISKESPWFDPAFYGYVFTARPVVRWVREGQGRQFSVLTSFSLPEKNAVS